MSNFICILQVEQHKKATMYKMNTHRRYIPLPTQPDSLITPASGDVNNIANDDSTSSKFTSRGLQTDPLLPPLNLSSTQTAFNEKQQSQVKIFDILVYSFFSHFLI